MLLSISPCVLSSILLITAVLAYKNYTDQDVLNKIGPDKHGLYNNLSEYNKSLVRRYFTCEEMGDDVDGGILSLLDRLGYSVTLASGSKLAKSTQIETAEKYVNECMWLPNMLPARRSVLLLTWNKNGDKIYPGTKWCGAGNKSEGPDRYGEKDSTDKCCETHDNATDFMPSSGYHMESRMWNPKYYTVTNCADDAKFFDCLLQANTNASLEFGQAFFDALRVPCFAYTYKRDCNYWRCKPWEVTQEKKWTFINPPNFYYTFMRMHQNGTYEAADDPTSWKAACELDPDLKCGNYSWMNPSKK